MMRSELDFRLMTWFQAESCDVPPFPLVASLYHRGGISGFIWLQPVDASCTPCPVDLRKKLGVKIKHIIGQDHEPLQLGSTELVDPSAQLMEIFSHCIGLSYRYVGNNLVGDWW